MAEKLPRTRVKRRGNRTVMTKLMNEVDSLLKAEPSDKKRLKAIATSLNEKLNLVKTLDEEIIENCAVEEVEAEIEESDEFNTRVIDLLRVINEATSSKDNNTGLSTVPTKNINETRSSFDQVSGSSGTWASENNVQLQLPGSATYGGFHSFNVTSSSTCHVENMQSSGNSVLAPSLIVARSTYSRELGPPWFYWSGRRREADVFPKKFGNDQAFARSFEPKSETGMKINRSSLKSKKVSIVP
ncbi:uncharacterized protein [Montipora foliosa]|uniref:uncharacterized protein isoform X1 n=1 Tax=Montipora foliosa TaxID=591990 RepID=UPI0035F18AD4